jgi:site-specific DNA recombinase
VRVIGASDGYDSTSKARKVNRAVRGLMSEVYLDDLAEKTHRGLERQARKHYCAGGKVYGYKLAPEWEPVKRDAHGQPARIGTRLEVDPAQAAVVVRILEAYADGKSPRAIAEALNADRIAPPGAGWNRMASMGRAPVWLASAIYGNPRLGTGIVRNPTYRGMLRWNRSKWVRDP